MTFDDLWSAACAEVNAIEMESDTLAETAERFRSEARAIVTQAAHRQAR